MQNRNETYWLAKRQAYSREPWASQPSLFVQTAQKYFTREGEVLELGAGLGQDGLWLAELGFEVTQTDILLEEMLPIKEDLELKRERVDLSVPLQYLPESFDVVYACQSLHYFDWATTERLFGEIFNILKPGGVLALLVNSTNDPEYKTGVELEEDYFEIDGIPKRFFDLETLGKLVEYYKPLSFDDKGSSYKDQAKGVNNLVRFIGQKG